MSLAGFELGPSQVLDGNVCVVIEPDPLISIAAFTLFAVEQVRACAVTLRLLPRSSISACCYMIFTAQCTLMHMRGLGIACRPSVRLSVCDVGGL